MDVIQTIADMKKWSRRARGTIGFVPTMGCLHDGHLSLARRSLATCRFTVCSIFVNPAQFGAGEDLDSYPRAVESDRQKLESLGVDALFLPRREEIYPEGYKTYVSVEEISSRLCGKSRPLHFRGVTTVVLKLFHIVRPQVAFFGEKDWQQLETIRVMARDLNLDVAIEGVPTAREKDGLAMSSRNAYLSPEQRESALSLSRALDAAKGLVLEGEVSAEKVRALIRGIIEKEDRAAIDYVSVCDPHSFIEQTEIKGKTLIALAVWVGKARLIDNCLVERN